MVIERFSQNLSILNLFFALKIITLQFKTQLSVWNTSIFFLQDLSLRFSYNSTQSGNVSQLSVHCEPVESSPTYFAGFNTYGKRKIVESLKLRGALLWKLLSFQFKTAMYIRCNLVFRKKTPEAVARSWWVLQKICFITFKSYLYI